MTPSDIANMSDDECLVAAMLLGLEWVPYKYRQYGRTSAGWFEQNGAQHHATDKYHAARIFLRNARNTI